MAPLSTADICRALPVRAPFLRALGTLAALGGIGIALATTTACGGARDGGGDAGTRSDGGLDEPDAPYVEETCEPDFTWTK
jgi:hypothetical protein